ncbi:hypothetical protein IF125_08675 [Empedobacter stercoris]|uniref:hypothetical protein n=1 Tax=Empedobacter stercoris TaxID=1628248 RepID=UPI001CE15A56|nr:hypothetical protein [Empedobacter stercoris]MCA4782338.1 hypothetical protein [Empedobacter stercoris]
MRKVSFDFDGTLTEKIVQDYAKYLINKGFHIYVCTFRTKEYNDKLFKIVDKSTPANNDLYKITDLLKIPRENIIFTEMDLKSKFLDESFICHLDDDWTVIKDLEKNSKVNPIDVMQPKWKIQCNEILNLCQLKNL